MAISKDEITKRLRAARAYAGLSQEELGEEIEASAETVKRSEAGKRTPKTPELRAIAEACGLPRGFFSVDFERMTTLAAMDDASAEMGEANRIAKEGDSKAAAAHIANAAQHMQRAAEALEAGAATAPPATRDGPPPPDPDHLPGDEDGDDAEAQDGRS